MSVLYIVSSCSLEEIDICSNKKTWLDQEDKNEQKDLWNKRKKGNKAGKKSVKPQDKDKISNECSTVFFADNDIPF